MSSNRRASIIAAASVAIATGCAGIAAASGAAGGTTERTIQLVERAGATKFVDLPPRARHQFDFSPGDLTIITRRLDDPSGVRAGSLEIACVTVTPTKQQCAGTLELHGGTLAVSGLSHPLPTTVVAVVGGTGAYAGASGVGLAKDRAGAGDVADLTIRLHS